MTLDISRTRANTIQAGTISIAVSMMSFATQANGVISIFGWIAAGLNLFIVFGLFTERFRRMLLGMPDRIESAVTQAAIGLGFMALSKQAVMKAAESGGDFWLGLAAGSYFVGLIFAVRAIGFDPIPGFRVIRKFDVFPIVLLGIFLMILASFTMGSFVTYKEPVYAALAIIFWVICLLVVVGSFLYEWKSTEVKSSSRDS